MGQIKIRQRPTIALATIVKNEEKVLARSLESVKDIVDEMVIVDTGSTDDTKKIIREYGGKVLDFEWCDDFSVARNFGIDHCTTDWILVLDADEELAEGVRQLPALLSTKAYLAYTATQIIPALDRATEQTETDPAGELRAVSRAYGIRLFRRRDDIRYRNPIHEQVTIGDMGLVGESPLVINHFGPASDDMRDWEARSRRNVRILTKHLTSNPNDGYLEGKLGDEHFRVENFNDAFFHYRQALGNLAPDDTTTPHVLRNMAWCLYSVGMAANASALLQQAYKDYPFYTDFLFVEGEIALQTGELSRAEALFEQCLKNGDPPTECLNLGGTGSWRVEERLRAVRSR